MTNSFKQAKAANATKNPNTRKRVIVDASIRGRGENDRSEAFKETDDYVDRWGRMDVSMEPRIM